MTVPVTPATIGPTIDDEATDAAQFARALIQPDFGPARYARWAVANLVDPDPSPADIRTAAAFLLLALSVPPAPPVAMSPPDTLTIPPQPFPPTPDYCPARSWWRGGRAWAAALVLLAIAVTAWAHRTPTDHHSTAPTTVLSRPVDPWIPARRLPALDCRMSHDVRDLTPFSQSYARQRT